MADLTSGADHDASRTAPSRRSTDRTEFLVYFAIIFVATLPLAVLTWTLHTLRSRSLKHKSPIARAWSQARIITPMIFSA